ncbi:MAG: antibiotic biosynthesis monooxygenase [Gammaproteobacteria bacterium]
MAWVGTSVEPPYFAVIFTSLRSEADAGYADMARRMEELARRQPGFLGIESARRDRFGITVSYWRDEASIEAWKNDMEHQEAQRLGRERWYSRYAVRIARVERDWEFAG